jgi:formylmethanofuran dehydrogenase subunit E
MTLAHHHFGWLYASHVALLVFLYTFTWREVHVILLRLEEVEEIVLQCAWCKSVKTAGDYTDKVSHTICPDCLKKELKNISGVQELPHDV